MLVSRPSEDPRSSSKRSALLCKNYEINFFYIYILKDYATHAPDYRVDLLSAVHVLHATQQPLINAYCQTKYMYTISIYVRRTQLSMQCVAYAIQVTNKTDKKVIPHKKKKPHTIQGTSLAWEQTIDNNNRKCIRKPANRSAVSRSFESFSFQKRV